MESIEFRRFVSSEAEELADLLANEAWPYHHPSRVDRADVLQRAAKGHYDNASARTFWIVQDARPVGMVRLFDLNDGTPLFDLRISQAHRGKGVGTCAVRWLTSYLFTELPTINRVEGTTRQDNTAMRRVFRRCGYVKEAHYRKAWPDGDGTLHDTVGYGILREDWKDWNGNATQVRRRTVARSSWTIRRSTFRSQPWWTFSRFWRTLVPYPVTGRGSRCR